MNYKHFLPIVEAIANLSKDPSSKIASIIFDDDMTILSVGYNGFPRGVVDSEERLNDRPTKYKFVCHSEANAIAQAARVGARLLGSSIVLNKMYPCSSCAKLIIQSGIRKVYVPAQIGSEAEQRWAEDIEVTKIMFNEANIEVIEYES